MVSASGPISIRILVESNCVWQENDRYRRDSVDAESADIVMNFSNNLLTISRHQYGGSSRPLPHHTRTSDFQLDCRLRIRKDPLDARLAGAWLVYAVGVYRL
jgi:hypothetical protein